jgi:general secretion pathway protein J
MTRRDTPHRASVAGFTLIEALVATALMGIVLSALATITAQWRPNWNRGFVRVQRTELAGVALDRITADLSAAEFIPPNRGSRSPLFDGTELGVIFVRTATGPNSRPGLEIVRYIESADARGPVLVRARAPFAPFDASAMTQLNFVDPVALLHPPFRVSFAYAGGDGKWKTTWQNAMELPAMIRLQVRDAQTEQNLAISTAVAVHVELPAACIRGGGSRACLAGDGATGTADADGLASAPPNVRRE